MSYLLANQVVNSDVLIAAIMAEFPGAHDFRFGVGLDVISPTEAYPFCNCQFVDSEGNLLKAAFIGEFVWDIQAVAGSWEEI